MNNDFLPKDYEVPTTGGKYMKLVEGQNKFRILSKPILGYEDWDDDKNMYRTRTKEEQPPVSRSSKENAKIKHFWAMAVWNYKDSAVQILELTQGSIQDVIRGLAQNVDWGNPMGYDLTITKSGKGLDTEYLTTPTPPKPLAKEISDAYAALTINLDALYENEDPFATNTILKTDINDFEATLK